MCLPMSIVWESQAPCVQPAALPPAMPRAGPEQQPPAGRMGMGQQASSELTVDYARSSLASGLPDEATLNQTPHGAPVIRTNLLNQTLR